MIEIRRIVCPVDFSEFSHRSLSHALSLARWYEAGVTVLHVVPPVPTVEGFPPSVNPVTLEPVSKSTLLELMGGFVDAAKPAGVPVRLEVREGGVANQILAFAGAEGADLLVLGTHGRGGFERWVLGSVTEKVLRKAGCPVLTVPRPAAGPPPVGSALFRGILCPVDFSAPSLRALGYALSLAQEADARLTVLTVLESLPDEFLREQRHFSIEEYRRFVIQDTREQLRKAIPEEARNWCQPEELLTEGRAYKEILRVAREQPADLIVMGVHGRNPIDIMLFGSTTQHVVREATCPVFTIRAA